MSDLCPRCESKSSKVQLLATTNEWEFYCMDCDVRFNSKGLILLKTARRPWTVADLAGDPESACDIRGATLRVE